MIKKIIIVLAVILVSVVTSGVFAQAARVHKITVTNTSGLILTDKSIAIKRKEIPGISTRNFYPLLTGERGDTIPAQLDDLDGDKVWDELVFVRNIMPKSKEIITLKWIADPIKFTKRTSVRFGVRQTKNSKIQPALSDTFYADQLPGVIGYQHYQTDGPTWENDKVAFRQYLDGRNSIDVFGKTVNYMTPENVGIGSDGVTENNYSVMKDWGTDILAVGNSVGIGGISFLIGDTLARLGVTEQDSLNNVDSTIFKIIAEGPVRSTISTDYLHWKTLGRNYSAEAITSITPGNYAFKNAVRFNNLKGDETLVVGLVNSKTDQKLTEIVVNDQWVVLLTHDKQTVNKEWWLGLALILPRKEYQGYME
ncbi:MAG TPA: DUF4861 family protein, partial [Segetibacter sp.]